MNQKMVKVVKENETQYQSDDLFNMYKSKGKEDLFDHETKNYENDTFSVALQSQIHIFCCFIVLYHSFAYAYIRTYDYYRYLKYTSSPKIKNNHHLSKLVFLVEVQIFCSENYTDQKKLSNYNISNSQRVSSSMFYGILTLSILLIL